MKTSTNFKVGPFVLFLNLSSNVNLIGTARNSSPVTYEKD